MDSSWLGWPACRRRAQFPGSTHCPCRWWTWTLPSAADGACV